MEEEILTSTKHSSANFLKRTIIESTSFCADNFNPNTL